jgi:hypothetical protein
MWRYGIHSFLELLRHQLPDSPEHMLAFIYLTYSMMALLKESVPAFEDTSGNPYKAILYYGILKDAGRFCNSIPYPLL